MAGKVQKADAGEAEEGLRLAARSSLARRPLIGRGYSMARVVAIESAANPLV